MKPVLEDKVILVTGAAGGIGSAACAVLAEAGPRLIVSDIAEEAGHAVADSICAQGGQAKFVPAELSPEDAI